MARIASSTIDEINSRVDIVSFVGEYVRLQKKGSDWWGCCPFHNEKTPSFHVVPDRNMYHCFGCGVGGGLINFFMEMEKVGFTEAALVLAKKAGIEILYEGGQTPVIQTDNTKDELIDLYKRVTGSFRYMLTSSDLGLKAREYAVSRGISPEISEKFMLGYAPADRYWLKKFLRGKNYSDEFLAKSGLFSKNYPDVAFFSDRLMFPICDRKGQPVAFGGRILNGDGPKYLNSGELVQYKKGETLYAFHLAKNEIRTQKTAILCEGYMDVMAYHQAEIINVVAPLGTAFTEDQVRVIKSFADTVLLSFDGDEAGQKATYRAILLCRKADLTVKVISMGNKGKDPAEILQKFGQEALKKIVESAIIDCDYLLSVMSSRYQTDTPEGKTKAALAFFPYIDALNSDIQKESSLELFAQVYSLKLEAVKADFRNRESARKRTESVPGSLQKPELQINIKMNAELRAMLAVAANIDYFILVRSSLRTEDFEDATARDLYIVLEECYRDDAVSYDSILSHCTSDAVRQLVTQTVTSGEFAENAEQIIKGSIQTIRQNSVKRKKERLVNKLRQWKGVTLDDQQELGELQAEIMALDTQLRSIKETDE